MNGKFTVLRGDLITFLSEHGICRTGRIVPGQPLALELWDGLFCLTQDFGCGVTSSTGSRSAHGHRAHDPAVVCVAGSRGCRAA